WLNRSRNSLTVSSGSSPTSTAYERTKARLKMPPGSLEMSFFSSASSAAAAILVLDAICRSEMPRRSRAWRSFPPKSSISAVTLDNLRKGCQTHEHADRRETRRARVAHGRHALPGDAANRDHRKRRSSADVPERIEAGDRMAG